MGKIHKVKEYSRQNMENRPFHNFKHAKRVADVASSNGNESELLRVAGYLHDVEQGNGHERRSAQVAKEKMPEWGYTKRETRTVADAIMGTVLFEKPSTSVGMVMSDADTHNFGLPFDEFKRISLQVKKEEAPNTTEEKWWTEHVIPLLDNHQYFVLNKFSNQKKLNLEKLRQKFG
jgi:uncharacterized protein